MYKRQEFWLDALEPRHINDPELQDFMRDRIELVADAGQKFGRSRVTLTSSAGKTTTIQIDAAKGAPGNPASLADLRAKFDRCVAGRLSETDSAELLDLIIRIDEIDELGRFLELLRLAGERAH